MLSVRQHHTLKTLLSQHSHQTEPNQINIDALIRHGGILNGYYITPRPRFNSVEMQRTMNMHKIRSTDLASYHILLHKKIEEIASFARRIGGDSSVINLTMNSESLKSSVNAGYYPVIITTLIFLPNKLKKFYRATISYCPTTLSRSKLMWP